MYSNRPFFGSRSRSKLINKTIRPVIDYFLLLVLLLMLVKVIIVIGFEQDPQVPERSEIKYYQWLFTSIGLAYLLRSIISAGYKSFSTDFFIFSATGLFIFFLFTLDIDSNVAWLNNHYSYALLILGLFVFELSRFDIRGATLVLNPAQLFMLSFGFLIVIGAALLKLPNATTSPITLVDALFTSTSAICVTGLIVVDTATQFTVLGKSIILILIQTGGIGIMTFTSFFGFFFRGGSTSFSERFVLSEFFSEDNISEIRKTLAKVIFITLLFEMIGAIFLYLTLDKGYFTGMGERIRFSVFHSVSAFCNAGFSTLTDGMNDLRVRGTYPVLYVVSFLVILGGIGFPILLNLYTFVKYKFLNLLSVLRFGRKKDFIPMMISINSRLVIYTTLFLLTAGTFFFFTFESNNTLEGMDLSGKIAHSFFGSVTPRTAGFNAVTTEQLSIAAIALTIFLMWIGASPVSAGGGIKTSTFAIAILNAFRIARVKNHIEFHKREFHERSVDRAFAIITLSLVILGCFSVVMYLMEPDKGPLSILFECVSAFSTVGLSLGITPLLADPSKILLIILMFMGRMGILTLLFALFRSSKTLVYRYPKENIVIT
ncbi:MAG: ATPase [Bacteroidales bacterium]|nr:ATPase [Bacteroidales bacterium]